MVKECSFGMWLSERGMKEKLFPRNDHRVISSVDGGWQDHEDWFPKMWKHM